jgi:hypothetical protein
MSSQSSATSTATGSATTSASASTTVHATQTRLRTATPNRVNRRTPTLPELLPPPRVPNGGVSPETPGIGGGLYTPSTSSSTSAMETVAGRWTPEVGNRLVVSALIALVLCIVGLVTVAVRRRQY